MKEFAKKMRDRVPVPVLLYHNIGPFRHGTNPSVTISAEEFEKHIYWLKRHGYVGILPSDWLSWYREGKRLPIKPVMITFDDAYADLVRYAFPVLEKHGFNAAVFVVTGWVGGTNAWLQNKYDARLCCMTEDQILDLAANGFEIGSHTQTHPDLRKLDDDEISKEMQQSAQYLGNLLGAPVKAFAYPYGAYSDAARKSVEQTYELAFTCEEGLNRRGTEPYLLRRKMFRPSDTVWDLAFYVRYGWSRRRVRRWWREHREQLGAWRLS